MAADCKVARLQSARLHGCRPRQAIISLIYGPALMMVATWGGYKWVYESVNGFIKSFGGVIRGLSRLTNRSKFGCFASRFIFVL